MKMKKKQTKTRQDRGKKHKTNTTKKYLLIQF